MEVFINKWLHTVYKHEVKPTTFERAERVVKNHILPAFAKCEVSSVKTYDVQQFLLRKSNDALSPATVKIIPNILSKAFQIAIDWELIRKNPTELIKKAEVKKISIHGLRHTNATLLMKQGINPKIVSERLGHANIGITLNIYFYTDLDRQIETVSKLEEMLG